MQQLYEPLIERDLDAIPAAVRQFRERHSSDELFLAVARFALLAYAPSQHAKHALIACLAVHDLRDELGERFDDAVTELAIYAAGSRQPWSEPPILEPPAVDPSQPATLEELLAAIDAGDRLRGERWLAKRVDDADLARDYFAAASGDLSDYGHKAIIAAAAWRLVPILGERGKYATLRVGIWEMTAYRGERSEASLPAMVRELLPRSLDAAIASGGELEAMHVVFLQEALLTMGEVMSEPPIAIAPAPSSAPVPVYRFARDFAQCLIAHAVAKRLRARFPELPLGAFLAAAHDNLERSPSFEEWSFA